eukprot:16448999-Heterocapsa_arctica.AAC.1
MRAGIHEVTYGRAATPTRRSHELLQETQDAHAAASLLPDVIDESHEFYPPQRRVLTWDTIPSVGTLRHDSLDA